MTTPDLRTVLDWHRSDIARWYLVAVCPPAAWERQEHRDADEALITALLRQVTADDLRDAIAAASPLNNPRLSEVDWATVAQWLPPSALGIATVEQPA